MRLRRKLGWMVWAAPLGGCAVVLLTASPSLGLSPIRGAILLSALTLAVLAGLGRVSPFLDEVRDFVQVRIGHSNGLLRLFRPFLIADRPIHAYDGREDQLSAVLSGIDVAVLVADGGGRIERANPAAIRLLGFNPVGQTLSALLEPSSGVEQARSDERLAGKTAAASRSTSVFALAGPNGPIEVAVSLTKLPPQTMAGFVAVLTDVTERLGQQRELKRLTTHDLLTGLPNRARISFLLESSIAAAGAAQRTLGVLSLDLSRFKLVTDTLGQRAGERLLLEVARRIQAKLGPGDALGRVGVDDFVAILNPGDTARAAVTADAILAAVSEPIHQGDIEHFLRPAVGVAFYPEHGSDAESLIRAADTALYAAKRRGGMQIASYDRRMGDQARHQLAIDQEMRHALGANEFVLYFQPKVSLRDDCIEGFEALIRWNRPGRGIISPADFIPIAEETGFITALDEWVLDEVCRQLRDWVDQDLNPVPVAVNVSPRHLRQCSAPAFLDAIDHYRIPRDLIEIEVTEHGVMQDIEHAIRVLGALKENGIRTAVDDFGTGHSSLSYLKRLPLSTLKIDRSFINGVPASREDSGIVSMIITMADLLHLDVVAEGVERTDQADFLREQNCRIVQGWLTGRPGPANEAKRRLSERRAIA